MYTQLIVNSLCVIQWPFCVLFLTMWDFKIKYYNKIYFGFWLGLVALGCLGMVATFAPSRENYLQSNNMPNINCTSQSHRQHISQYYIKEKKKHYTKES